LNSNHPPTDSTSSEVVLSAEDGASAAEQSRGNKISTAELTKTDGKKIELSVGTLIRYRGRPDGVKITGFTSKDTDTRGPIGLYYLPWRGDHWAEIAWSFKGNPRHLIAFPVGSIHYGEQIEWDTVELLSEDEALQIKMLLLEA
jgi:hypothetical protein